MGILQKLKDLFLIEDEPEMELLAQFRHTVNQEYTQFKDSVLSMDKEDIFSLAYQINFYDALHEYILYGGPIPNEVLYNSVSETISFFFFSFSVFYKCFKITRGHIILRQDFLFQYII